MNRGCIAIGEIKCYGCNCLIGHGERYLLVEEEEGKKRFCVECCKKEGKAAHVKEKGEEVITFFPSTITL